MKNAICWFEIPTAQLERAQAFYEAVLGQPMERETMGGEQLAVFAHERGTDAGGEGGCGGALLQQQQGPGAPGPSDAATVVYLNAAPSLAAALERATAHGGQVLVPRQALPDGTGFYAHIRDLDGNRVGLYAPQ